jgi:hypothetical protein
MNSSEAKWMVRVVLRAYSPVHVLETLVLQQFHFLLPDLLRFQNSFEAAVKLLQNATVRKMPTRVEEDVEGPLRESAVRGLVPRSSIPESLFQYCKSVVFNKEELMVREYSMTAQASGLVMERELVMKRGPVESQTGLGGNNIRIVSEARSGPSARKPERA